MKRSWSWCQGVTGFCFEFLWLYFFGFIFSPLPSVFLEGGFSGSPNDALCEDYHLHFMEMSLSIIARCILACDLVFISVIFPVKD
jgi:hypothetical protein